MAYREVAPHPALRPFVDRFWKRSGDGRVQKICVLPDGCMDLVLDLDRGSGFAVGTMSRADVVELPPAHRLVAVRFRPAGAAPFLGLAAHELTDREVDFDDLQLRFLPGDLFDRSPGTGDALGALQGALLARVPAMPAPDRRVAAGVRALFGEAPPAVERLAGELGLSRQHLGRVFRDQVGVGPKLLARIARLQRAVRALQTTVLSSLAQAAAEVGYFDEAHMDRDFRELVGLTPGRVKGDPGSIRPIASLLSGA